MLTIHICMYALKPKKTNGFFFSSILISSFSPSMEILQFKENISGLTGWFFFRLGLRIKIVDVHKNFMILLHDAPVYVCTYIRI